MSNIEVVSRTQHIILNPATSSVTVINTGPQGPAGLKNFMFVTDTVPVASYPGDLWFNASTGREYVWYDNFWVEIGRSFQANPLTVDGNLLTRTAGALDQITRSVLAGDAAFVSRYAATRSTVIGQFYQPVATRSSTGTMTLSSAQAVAIYLRGGTYNAIRFNCTTLGASSFVRLGLYTDANGGPATLVVDGGLVDTSTIGLKDAAINVTIADGWYWLVCVAQGGTAPATTLLLTDPGVPASAADATSSHWTAVIAGALPTTFPAATVATSARAGVSIKRSA